MGTRQRYRLVPTAASDARRGTIGASSEWLVLFVLLDGLLRLLPVADLAERHLVVDVGNRAGRVVTELAGRVAPPVGLHPLGLGQQGDEDLGLLVAVARKGPQAVVHLGGIVDAVPDVGGIAVVVGHE